MGKFSDFSLDLQQDLLVGKSGTGKTTKAFNLLLSTPARCRFIFDPKSQAAQRLRLRPARTAQELERQVSKNWVCFYPWEMFPASADDKDSANAQRAFRFFCKWVYEVSCRGRGKKMLFLDEIWEFVSPNSIPPELAKIVQEGRCENIHLITATQRPHKLNEAIVSQATSVYAFNLSHDLALSSLERNLDLNTAGLAQLRNGSYLHYDLKKSTVTRGKVF